MSKSQGMALNHLMHLNCLLFNVKFRTLYYQKKQCPYTYQLEN